MLQVYRRMASRVGTPDALELAQELADWHDAMVRHERSQAALGETCDAADECPHVDAMDLWRRAQRLFGADAEELAFLRASAGADAETSPQAVGE